MNTRIVVETIRTGIMFSIEEKEKKKQGILSFTSTHT
jgi:hypothetical protein